MKMTGFLFVASLVAILHVAALTFAFVPWHWKYLLVTIISGGILWGVLSELWLLWHWRGLLLGVGVALMVQQAAFWFWRAQLGGIGWPVVQFASIHFLIGLVFGWGRRRRASRFLWHGTMKSN